MTNFATAKEAIEHSKEYDTIGVCDNTNENMEYLKSNADDWTDTNNGWDFWADGDGDDMEWRVEVYRTEG